MLGPLDPISLDNLASAEELEQVEFRRHLTRLFPTSLDLALAKVATLIRARLFRQAVRRGTELLEREDWTPAEIRRGRLTRFQAATLGRQPTEFAADFLFFQDDAVARQQTVLCRLWLGRVLVEISSPRLVEALAMIQDQFADDPDWARLIVSEIERWITLRDLEAARTRERIKREDQSQGGAGGGGGKVGGAGTIRGGGWRVGAAGAIGGGLGGSSSTGGAGLGSGA